MNRCVSSTPSSFPLLTIHQTSSILPCRLEFQLSSMERQLQARQQAMEKTDRQLAELKTKYDACPKPEVLEK